MIQRVQTLYILLGVVALLALLAVPPLWESSALGTQVWFGPLVVGALGITVLLAVVAVFRYKNRQQQRQLVLGAQVGTLLTALGIYAGLFLTDELTVYREGILSVGWVLVLVLPMVAYLGFWLARRSIQRDIDLVRSMDRLR